MTRRVAGLAVCFCVLTGAAQAQEALAVGDIGGARFEVVGKSHFLARDYWCEAATYARSKGWKDRVYLVRGIGDSTLKPGRRAAVFTLDPAAAGISPASPQVEVTLAVQGDNMSVTMGRSLCAVDGGTR